MDYTDNQVQNVTAQNTNQEQNDQAEKKDTNQIPQQAYNQNYLEFYQQQMMQNQQQMGQYYMQYPYQYQNNYQFQNNYQYNPYYQNQMQYMQKMKPQNQAKRYQNMSELNDQFSNMTLKDYQPVELTNINPENFEFPEKDAYFFVIKSYKPDNIITSTKYGVWCSTRQSNQKLNEIYKNNPEATIYLLYSVNASGQFCAVSKMTSEVDFNTCFPHWSQQKKWYGVFNVQFLFLKDIPNKEFKHLRNSHNLNKPISNSKDSQEIPFNEGVEALKIFQSYKHETSLQNLTQV